ERVYEEMKCELGLDHFEGRSFLGWHHHISVAICCYAFVIAERMRHFPPHGPTVQCRSCGLPRGLSDISPTPLPPSDSPSPASSPAGYPDAHFAIARSRRGTTIAPASRARQAEKRRSSASPTRKWLDTGASSPRLPNCGPAH